jgi:alpha-D-xyloside xylohydrolase
MFSSSFAKLIRHLSYSFVVILACSTVSIGSPTIKHEANGAVVPTSTGFVRVEVCAEDVIHIFASAADAPARPLVPTVVRACDGTKFTTTEDNYGLHLETRRLRIDVARDTGSVRFMTSAGEPILSEQPDRGRIIVPSNGEGSSGEVEQAFLLSPEEALYGLGQHQSGFLNLRDIPVRLLQANTDIAIPFLISTKGYGLLWNNAALTDFNPATQAVSLDSTGAGTFQTGKDGDYGFLLSGNLRNRLRLSVDGKQIIDIKNMWVPWSAGARMHLAANTTYKVLAEAGGNSSLSVRAPSDTMAFHSDAGQSVDYYFFYGPEPSQVMAQYRDFTGAAPLLPRWAYGFWQCRERYSSQQQILDTAAEFRRRQIPVDALVQDWQYWGKYGWNAMRFDERFYPDPAQMLSKLHQQDFHMVISVWAKFGAETAVNHELADAHLLLRSAASTGEPGETKETESWADLFNPKAQKAFWADINRNLFDEGLDGWWLDASEPEGDPLKKDDTFLGPGNAVRNAFPLFETSAVYDGQKATSQSKRVVILSRSSFAGQQRNNSISWSGDITGNWETLRRQIPGGLSFSMSGIPYWTTDIGGFFRPKDQYTSADYHELLIRWFEYGAFCPIFRIHGYQSETEMWKYGPDVEQVLLKYDQLRYRLMPYIYSKAWGVTSRGEILMKALPFVYPGDPSVRDVGDQFLFGDSLLVNPVTEKSATTRNVVLPKGDAWVNFWTGQNYDGGQTIVADAPLDRMPILVKQGSIVPLGPVVQSTADTAGPLELRIYGGKDTDFQLYEDSGDGYGYEHGAKATIPLHWDERHNTLSIGDRTGTYPGILKNRTMRIVLVRPNHGVGSDPADVVDRTLTYEGQHLKVDLGKKR